MNYYLRATGSTCYDRTGLTFPNTVPMDFQAILRKHDVVETEWKPEFGWSNQPDVLCFQATSEQARAIGEEFSFQSGIIVRTMWEEDELRCHRQAHDLRSPDSAKKKVCVRKGSLTEELYLTRQGTWDVWEKRARFDSDEEAERLSASTLMAITGGCSPASPD